MAATARPPRPRAGHLVIIGGAEDKLRQRTILSRFVNLAGGPAARILVISTASSLGDEATDLYASVFQQLGVAEITSVRPETRDEANAPRVADMAVAWTKPPGGAGRWRRDRGAGDQAVVVAAVV